MALGFCSVTTANIFDDNWNLKVWAIRFQLFLFEKIPAAIHSLLIPLSPERIVALCARAAPLAREWKMKLWKQRHS